jgi:hypothetical protein
VIRSSVRRGGPAFTVTHRGGFRSVGHL